MGPLAASEAERAGLLRPLWLMNAIRRRLDVIELFAVFSVDELFGGDRKPANGMR